MSKEKRLIFTVTSGRSGTRYLTHVLEGLPNIAATHEPKPGFHEWLPQARHDPQIAKQFLMEKKLPFIHAFPEATYVEASHYFCKGFIEPLLELGIVPDLILLRRNPRKVASSWFLIGGGMEELRNGEFYQHLLGPHEPNFLPAQGYEAWNDYQLCYWYALESHFRIRHYAQLIAWRGGKTFDTYLQPLASGDNYGRLLAWMGVPESIVAARIKDKKIRYLKVNEKLGTKSGKGREKGLDGLNLETLEAQVRDNCDLSGERLQEALRCVEDWKQYAAGVAGSGEKVTIQPVARDPGPHDLRPFVRDAGKASIFVCIASYRDPECQWTVKDMFEKASHPERISAGICWQYDPKEDEECFPADYPRPEQVRVIQYHSRDSRGANWARAHAFTLWQGEEYALVIDSHMRFEPGWDELLLEALMRCPGDKSLLTAWLPGYKPPNRIDPNDGKIARLHIAYLGKEQDAQLINFNRHLVPVESVAGRMDMACGCAAGCIFGLAQAFTEVPFDPYIDFWGDEINQSARLWTHGWNFFQLDRRVMYHYWDPENIKDRNEYRDRNNPRHRRARVRNLHLFGIEAGNDAAAIAELDKYPLGAARTLADYWAFAGIDLVNHSLAPHATQGRWGAATPPDVRGRMSDAGKKSPSSIFVNMASYRDPECRWTLKDLFAKARHPERIHVGICLQADPVEDKACMVETDRPGQVRISQCHWRESQGANWARHQAQLLWDGEEYVLQIDSHMRFEPGWDDTLIEMLNRCPSPKPLLCAYLPNYDPPDKRNYGDGHLLRIRVRRFGGENDPQLLHITGTFVQQGDEREGLYPSPFYVANFMFARASTLEEVPIDPHIHFYGDEISYAARLWTHGYDIFQPDRIVMFHYWVRKESLPLQHYRSTRTARSKRSLQRVRHLLGFETAQNPDALAEIDRYGLGTARPLDDLWTFGGIDWRQRSIAKNALEGRWNMIARNKAREKPVKKSSTRKLPRLFVNIASYRDRECQWTVKDLFEKAAHPDRINVGICWQFDAKEDEDCFQLSTRPNQVRMLPVGWREGEGVCWARHQTQQLWDGEEYNLQIDAHMRFVPDWDELMIGELNACEADKPLLSCSPAIYTPPDNLQKDLKPTVRRVRPFQPDGNIRGQGEYIDRRPDRPLNGAFVAAGFVFSRGNVVAEVPYDPYLYFDQEEITYAARLYTHGWDVFSSRQPFMYHYYNDNKAQGGSVRPLHWSDVRKEDESRINYLQGRGLKRFNHLTGYRMSEDAEVTKELAAYGFGGARSLQQFEEYAGIDFKRKIASEKALRCLFIKDLNKYSRGIHIPEIDDIPSPHRGEQGKPSQVRPLPNPLPKGEGTVLEAGDFIPLFEAVDTSHKTRAVEVYGGQHCMLFFLPAGNAEYVSNFFRHLQQQFGHAKQKNVWQLFILDDTVEKLIEFREKVRTPHLLWADPDRKLARAFGLCRPGDTATPPVGYVLDNNLRIVRRRAHLNAAQLAASIVEDCQDDLENYRHKNLKGRVISEMAPALIIPNAFTPELCKKCIDAFRTGHTFDGTVGAEEKLAYRPNAKIRTDHIISGALLNEIDDKFSRSVFPEIKKIFGFEVTHRELYKVGLYKGDKGGFFKAHRDNFDASLGYRRLAMTLHLNDDYDGGGLRFPEYGEHIYRPKAGGAIVFSCATLHEARPVMVGERYILVCFFHGEEEEAYRRHYLAAKGSPLKIRDYTPRLRQPTEAAQSRDYYRDWRKKHVRLDGQDKK